MSCDTMQRQTASYEVSDEARLKADRCTKDCGCLKGDLKESCKIERCILDKFLFVKPVQHSNCPYLLPFGLSSFVCWCPVRNEVYRHYAI